MTAELFSPPDEPILIYEGQVMHARLRAPQARFTYRVFNILIDVDRLGEADRQSRLFSVGRFNLLSFNPRDHGAGDGDLRSHINSALREAGMDRTPSRILLLCYPRILGFSFNPISVFFAYSGAELIAVVYEVRNTIGGVHSYIAPVREGELALSGLRQEREKAFYVSPFMPMGLRYRFRLRPPTQSVKIRILELSDSEPVLAATFSGARLSLNSSAALASILRTATFPLKVMLGIHWQALKLWLRGAPVHRSSTPPQRISYDAVALPRSATDRSS